MTIYKPMTKKQLKGVVAEYAATFPDWMMLEDNTAFFRDHGPIRQMIWLQRLSYAAYRPTHVISALPIAIPSMLTQLMDVRNRQVEFKWHERKWRGAVAAMEQQFKPNIRKPIDLAEVLTLCEAEVREATNDLAMLAILYAWLERKAEATDCCERMQHCPLPTLAPMPKWEEAMRSFGRDLARAIEAGNERAFLSQRDASYPK